MADTTVTVTGLIATEIRHNVTAEGLDLAQFRLASNNRRFDRATKTWVDAETNWFTIVAFRQLAANLHASLTKGHRIVVTGKLKVREWHDGEKSGTVVEIVADALGPDLAWGRASYERTPRLQAVPNQAESGADAGAGAGADAGGAGADADADADAAAAQDAAGFPAEAQLAAALPF